LSVADDMSLTAMKAARMSTGSIAFTMGWSERRVERRWEELQALEKPAAGKPEADPPPVAVEVATPGRTEAPAPRRKAVAGGREDNGFVTRTFALVDGGRGAAVLLDGSDLVFTETGHRTPALGGRIHAEPADGCFRMVETEAVDG